jgi:hypothetical protein
MLQGMTSVGGGRLEFELDYCRSYPVLNIGLTLSRAYGWTTPLPRVGNIPFCRQSSWSCAVSGPRFCRLPSRRGGGKRRSLSAKNSIAGPPATLALCLALVRRSRREVRCSHQKAVDVVSAEEGRRFSGAPSLFTEQLHAAGKFSISRSLWSGS